MSTQRRVNGCGGNYFICRADITSAPRKRAQRPFPGVCSEQIIIENVIRSLSDNGKKKKKPLNTTLVNLIFCVRRVGGTYERGKANSIYNREIFKKTIYFKRSSKNMFDVKFDDILSLTVCANQLGTQRNEGKNVHIKLDAYSKSSL